MALKMFIFVNNEDEHLDLNHIQLQESKCMKHTKFYQDITVQKEIEVIRRIFG